MFIYFRKFLKITISFLLFLGLVSPVNADEYNNLKSVSSNEALLEEYPSFNKIINTENGLTVSISAKEGVFKSGVSVIVTPVNNLNSIDEIDGKNVIDIKAVDITFFDVEGKEVEPNGNVNVTLQSDEKIEGDLFNVIHVDDDGSVSIVDDATNQSADFNASSFSIYAIVGVENGIARRTYNFYDGNTLLNTQIIKNGDTLIEPEIIQKDNMLFEGWFDSNGNKFTSFNTVNDINSQTDEVINLYTKYNEVYYVIFHDYYGNISKSVAAKNNDVISTNDILIEIPTNKYISSWTTDPNQSVEGVVGDSVVVKGSNIDLYPITKDVNWVFFNGNDDDDDSSKASIVDPLYVKEGQLISEPTITRTGYDFVGWFLNKDGSGDPYDFSVSPSESIELFAKWIPKTVNYTIVISREKLVDGNYVEDNYVESDMITLTGETGKEINYDEVKAKVEAFINEKISTYDRKFSDSYYHYVLNEEKSISENQNKVISGTGGTTINFYYDLRVYDVIFHVYGGPWNPIDKNKYDAYIEVDNVKYTDYPIKYRAGQKVLNGETKPFALYPNVNLTPKDGSVTSNYSGYVIKQISGGKTINFTLVLANTTTVSPIVLIHDMPGITTIDLYGTVSNKTYHTKITRYFETLEDNTYETKHFEYYSATSNKYIPDEFSGFKIISTPEGMTPSDETIKDFHIYYQRLKYEINFFNNNANEKNISDIKYGQPINNLLYVPDKPIGLNEDYVFIGWEDSTNDFRIEYINDEFVNNDLKMPSYNLNLYAVWKIKEINITFDSNGGSKEDIQIINSGKLATKPINPIREGFEFLGWVDENGSPFNFNKLLTSDTKLYARWSSNDYIRIKYDPKEGSGEPVDSNTYIDISSARILNGPSVAPTNKYFKGWKFNDTIYSPNESLVIKSSDATTIDGKNYIILEAVYEEYLKGTSIVLYSNDNRKLSKSYSLENNSTFKIPSTSDINFNKSGYTFVGWNTKNDGSGNIYNIDDEVGIDNNEPLPNELFAIWKKNPSVEIISNVPNTSDRNMLSIYYILFTASLIVLYFTLLKRKKTNLSKNRYFL